MKKEYINPKCIVFDLRFDTILQSTSDIVIGKDPTDDVEAIEARSRFGADFSFEADFSCE